MTGPALAEDDVVATWDEVGPTARTPLVVVDALTRFLDRAGLGTGPLQVTPLGGGHSNVTLLLTRDDLQLVLRRPPRPPWPPRAHDVLREARIVASLATTPVPVATVLATCPDDRIIGAPFYVMGRVAGVVFDHETPAGFDPALDAERVADEVVDRLLAVHDVDLAGTGLADLARPSGYLQRQVKRFGCTWSQVRTRALPALDEVTAWLADHIPPHPRTTLVHGDYRLGNLLFTSDPFRVSAVLDWELATLGDPLADLGFLVAGWVEPGDPSSPFEFSRVTRRFASIRRRDLVERYARDGAAIDDLPFYVVLAMWKLAVIMEGNLARVLHGASDDPFARSFGDGVTALAERAMRIGPRGDTGFLY